MAPHIHKVTGIRLYFIPVRTRLPLKFGPETLTSVTCARVALRIADEAGREAEGWGETPLSVQWAWPSSNPYEARHQAMKDLCLRMAKAWMECPSSEHPLEMGYQFQEHVLPDVLAEFNWSRTTQASGQGRPTEGQVAEPVPRLAALVCSSPFDIALHDAFGKLVELPVYDTYGTEFLPEDLSRFLEPAHDSGVSFQQTWPANFLLKQPPQRLRAWHLVGGMDLLGPGQLTGAEPHDGYPVALADWIQRDGLKCLKIKLRGNDSVWDYDRLVAVGTIAAAHQLEWLSADFNCTVQDPAYVKAVLDRLRKDSPRIYDRLLYVEQPFPYDLEAHRLDVHSLSALKPLFLDESAHDWRMIRLGRELGWTGVALKTCKTQTGAILSACWAKAHGLSLMVQDLTNPMLAQIPHVLLAAHVGTLMGVETNAMQFYPDASVPEAAVHPRLYQRRDGEVDLSTVRGPGFGYRLDEIKRALPPPSLALG
ncbi:MAG TPA: mandelate racemase/muconate lactonizing enzyme family protein [Candidatus Acidoferrum sp.]|jgi:L-alanine-DL-glutamate epimerase-like enolase superfamily enzyme|nr:mandelate racemase/muconate lactonizing enzyme family protein [Candidatus Acidoferrum sp.]